MRLPAVLGDVHGAPSEESVEPAQAWGPMESRRHPAETIFVAIPIKILLVTLIFSEWHNLLKANQEKANDIIIMGTHRVRDAGPLHSHPIWRHTWWRCGASLGFRHQPVGSQR